MSVESIMASAAQSQGFPAPGTGRGDLNMEDFFKLLTTQLVSQDPLKPMEDVEFISQMTGFNTLRQTEITAANLEKLLEQQESVAAQNLIGRSVRAESPTGDPVAGVVTHVEKIDGRMTPFIGGVQIAQNSIYSVENAPAAGHDEKDAEEEAP